MSTIDERIVQMKFDNAQFEAGVKQTNSSLDDLKNKLNLSGAAKGLQDINRASGNIGGLLSFRDEIGNISKYFSAMGVIGVTVISNLTNKALNAGLQIARSLSVAPLLDGFHEYETNLNSIQTILANTSTKGGTLETVNAALQELNTYSDKTIYNFSEMARNIGTFTAAGVGLSTSVAAIKGIANLAAVSGSSSMQASTAMYQLSQALASGTVKLMDWNSVVNAGMGGEVFKNAIMDTARAHGVAIDAMIKKEGSFRDTLQNGWFTSEILTETLSKFTGDMTADQLKAMGYNQKQIEGILKMGQTAQDAATKVKTMTQLISTLQEAAGSGWTQTWQIIFGDFDEAKELFTSLSNNIGGVINASSTMRNELLEGWKIMGGRTRLLAALTKAVEFLRTVLLPIGKAFQDIFPAITVKQLYWITQGFYNWVSSLKLTWQATDGLRRTAAGLFAILHIGWTIIKQVVKTLWDLLGFTAEGSDGILQFTGNIGDFFVALDKAISSGNGLSKVFQGIGRVLQVPIAIVKAFIALLGAAFDTITNVGNPTLDGFADRVVKRFEPLKKVGEVLMVIFNAVGKVVAWVAGAIGPIVARMMAFSQNFGVAVGQSLRTVSFEPILDLINTGLLGAIVILFQRFFKAFLTFSKSGGPLVKFSEGFKAIFGQITGVLEQMQNKLKAQTLLAIAGAIGIIAASAVALSLVDPVRLASALTGITVMMGQIFALMMGIQKYIKFDALKGLPLMLASMILLGIALNILASAVTKLAKLDWNELARGMVGVIVLMGVLVGAAKLLQGEAKGMLISAPGVIAMAIAIKILASAVTDLAGLSWEDMAKGVVGLTGVMGALVGFVKIIGKEPAKLVGTGVAMILIASAVKILASALSDLGQLSVDEIARGLAAMAGALLIITKAMDLMPTEKLIVGSISMVIIASAMLVLSNALAAFGSMSLEEIGKGLLVLAGSLLIITSVMDLMQGTLGGAIALVVVSAAMIILANAFKEFATMSWDDIGRSMVVLAGGLLILAAAMAIMGIPEVLLGALGIIAAAGALALIAPALVLLGTMSWDDIGRSMAVLGAALAILAVGGVLLLPALPGLLGLGFAILLIGGGVFLAAIGLAAMAVAITALAVAGAAGMGVLMGSIRAIGSLIPYIAQQIGLGIIAIALVISQSGPTIIAAFVTLLTAFMTAINTVSPLVVETLFSLIMLLVKTLLDNVPKMVDSGLKLIVGILNGIAKNIDDVVESGIDVIVAFINGVSRGLPKLIQAGINLVISFINGLADGIRNNTARMNKAGANLADAIIDGMTSGLRNGVSTVIREITKIATNALNTAKDILGIRSPSKKFAEIGMYTMQGMAMGVVKFGGLAINAVKNVGSTALTTLRDSMSRLGEAVSGNVDMAPVIRPVLDLTSIKKDSSLISDLLSVPTIKADTSFGIASDIAAQDRSASDIRAEQAAISAEQTPSLVIEQTNISPKPISPADTYRNTKSAVAVAKGVLTK